MFRSEENDACDSMDKDKKSKKTEKVEIPERERSFKTRTEIRVERFVIEEMDRYIKLHKEHEKDLRYIG